MSAMGRAAIDPALAVLRGTGPYPPAGDTSWDDWALRLARERLSGVALGLLARAGRLADLTPLARRTLESDFNSSRASQIVLFDRFTVLADCLDRAVVPFIVHKGGALAPLVYDRPEDRPMVDVDLLIRPGDWERARGALVAAGYVMPRGALESFWRENYYNLAVSSPTVPPSSFDLHWGIAQPGRYWIETEELFSRAVPYRIGDSGRLRLGNEDLLLSLFLHLAYHYFEPRLLWMYDMKLVTQRWPIDWDALAARAEQWGLLAVTSLSLLYLEKLFPGTVPAAVTRRLRLGPVRSMLLRPWISSSPGRLVRGEQGRLNQMAIGLLTIDRPAQATRFATDKIGRSLKWLGRRPKRR